MKAAVTAEVLISYLAPCFPLSSSSHHLPVNMALRWPPSSKSRITFWGFSQQRHARYVSSTPWRSINLLLGDTRTFWRTNFPSRLTRSLTQVFLAASLCAHPVWAVAAPHSGSRLPRNKGPKVYAFFAGGT